MCMRKIKYRRNVHLQYIKINTTKIAHISHVATLLFTYHIDDVSGSNCGKMFDHVCFIFQRVKRLEAELTLLQDQLTAERNLRHQDRQKCEQVVCVL